MTAWALVTGASSGIGLEVVSRFLEDGRSVVALARRGDRWEGLLSRHGDRLRTEQVDVRDQDAVQDVVRRLTKDGDAVSVLVNSAGLSLGLGSFADGAPEDWRTMIDTNIDGVLNCARAVLPAMISAGSGHIVNIGSLAAEHEYFGGNVYAATKAFVHHLSANLRVDLQGTGVRVTCVAPGMVRSEFALVRFKGDGAKAAALYDGIDPLSPRDVADSVAWACGVPGHVNVNYIELMPVDQPFGLGLSRRALAEKERS